ncbi:MAG TPA: tetratricopeptide repeat protein [Tepidisphaeraceae bacterium]|nr:tetratricopeptide repeat protein [Tepidisphaeraceae bacterium]
MKAWAARVGIGLVALILVGCVDTTSYQYYATDKGIEQFKAGDYATAAGSFQDALRHEPRDYEAEYYLAASHDALKMHQQAVSEYKATLQIMNTTSQGRRDKQFRYQVIDALAQSIANGSDIDSQITELKQNANTPEDYYLLAKVYQYAQDPDSAMTEYEKATLQDPSNAKYAADYGLYLDRIGQTGKAEQELRKAQSLGDKDPQITAALERMGSVAGASQTNVHEPSEPKTPTGKSTTQTGPE